MHEFEKEALMAKALGRVRHPLDEAARKALETGFRKKKFEVLNEKIIRKGILEPLKLDKAVETGTRYAFFPKKTYKGFDPVRKYAPRGAGKKAVELLADNPELIPLLAMPLRGGTVPGYMVGKSFLYRTLGVPSPGHMRHLRQRQHIMDIAKTTGAGVGLGAGGVAGHRMESSRQEKRDKKNKRAEMYKATADELQKIAVEDTLYPTLGGMGGALAGAAAGSYAPSILRRMARPPLPLPLSVGLALAGSYAGTSLEKRLRKGDRK